MRGCAPAVRRGVPTVALSPALFLNDSGRRSDRPAPIGVDPHWKVLIIDPNLRSRGACEGFPSPGSVKGLYADVFLLAESLSRRRCRTHHRRVSEDGREAQWRRTGKPP